MLESMQRVLWYVQSYEKLFAQRQLEEFGEKQKKELAEKRRELDKAKLRVREIDAIIQKLYEDNATGKISDERFATMSVSLENEQSELKDRIPALENELENAKIKTEGLQRFIEKQNRLPVWNPSRPNWYTNLLRKSWYPHPNTRTASAVRSLKLLQRRWYRQRADSRRNGRILPRTHQQKAFLKGKNGIAIRLHRISHNNISLRYKSRSGHLPYGGCPEERYFCLRFA